VFYAATHQDAAAAGFDDGFIYKEISVAPGERAIPTVRVADQHATRPFEEWAARAGKVAY
jgi:guanine deaminase